MAMHAAALYCARSHSPNHQSTTDTIMFGGAQIWLEEFLAKEKEVNGVKDEPEKADAATEADKAEAAPAGMQPLQLQPAFDHFLR